MMDGKERLQDLPVNNVLTDTEVLSEYLFENLQHKRCTDEDEDGKEGGKYGFDYDTFDEGEAVAHILVFNCFNNDLLFSFDQHVR